MTTLAPRPLSAYNTDLRLKGFNVFQIESDGQETRVYSRKDFYKICITTGQSIIHYADRSFEVDGTILFFGNPHIPYSWQTLSSRYVGYSCLFSEEFLKQGGRSESLQQSPLFKLGGTPIFNLREEQREYLGEIFRKMMEEQHSEYLYKDDLIRNYISLMIHEALKLQPSENFDQHKNAASRLTKVFFELLERQFPIESPAEPLALRTAHDYAGVLAVHVNYLNRSVKEVTGKTTTALIAERMLTEAKALLRHTDWNVAEVAYALGYDHQPYFNNFFRKMTGTTPKAYRAGLV